MHIFKKFSTHKKAWIIFCAFCALILLFAVSICVGAVTISIEALWKIIKSGNVAESGGQILYYVRLPRTLAALLAGTAFAMSGAILQTVLSNPMCSPSIIGVNAGAGLFMIITAAFFPTAIGFAPVSAFLGAVVAVLVVYFLAKKTGASQLAIVLSGIAVSSLLSAITDTIITLVPDAKISRVDFLIGSFSGVTMENVVFALPYICIALVVTFALCVDINVLSLGDSTAASLGLKVGFIRGLLLICAALFAGAAISLGGLIGFVGLIVPHVAKMLIGFDHKYLLPLTAIMGGAFCLFCDILARILFIPFEIPVGIVMSLIGSPFFIWLILTRKRRRILD